MTRVVRLRLESLRMPAGPAAPDDIRADLHAALSAVLEANRTGRPVRWPEGLHPALRDTARTLAARIGDRAGPALGKGGAP